MKQIIYFWRRGLWALISLFFILITGMSLLYFYLESELPNINALNTMQLEIPLRIYTQDGKLIQEYGEKRRIPLTYEQIPKTLIYALIATEDQRFFEHPGVDILGLARAAWRMLKTGTKSEGGSTITMQVARNFFLTREKTFLRKFNEILLAIKIDRELSKEKILALYLNSVYLGNRAYGVGAAANIYYGKFLHELNLSELAMIAGLPKAPSTQNPIANSIAAQKRRDHVLERLLEEKYITNQQHEEAIKQPVTVKYHATNIEVSAPYVAEMIRQSLYEHFGADTYTKGYNVYTTIKSSSQIAANQVVVNHLIAYDHRHGYRGPITNIGNAGKIHTKLSKYSEEQINFDTSFVNKTLANYPIFYNLEPAIIVSVSDKEAQAKLQSKRNKSTQTITIKWDGLSWAKPALKRGWVGKSPTSAKQVMSPGDIVYVRHDHQKWFLTQIPRAEAALVALNPKNGALEALVGGFSFEKSKFNRATQATRQPGSSFKPFLFAAALNKGYTLATLINDAPIIVEDPSQPTLWRPQNVNHKFNGPTRLKEALVRSQNTVSIRILDDLGLDYAIEFATHFGFQAKQLPKALSLALGTMSVSPLELTAAYAVFANGGYKIEPYLIDHITDNNGKILLQASPAVACDTCMQDSINTEQDNPVLNKEDYASIAPRVVPYDVIFLINTALKDVVRHGTAHAAVTLNRHDIAGKTGTTNDQVDAWFSGFNPELVVTTWVGYDNNQESLHEYAASLALPMWIDFIKIVLHNQPETSMSQPDNIVAVRIDPITGAVVSDNQSNSIVEYFRKQDLPVEETPPNNIAAEINTANVVKHTTDTEERTF